MTSKKAANPTRKKDDGVHIPSSPKLKPAPKKIPIDPPCSGCIPLPKEVPDGPWYPRVIKKPDGTYETTAVPDGDPIGTGTGSAPPPPPGG